MKSFLFLFNTVYLLSSVGYSQTNSTQSYIESINNELRINNPGRNSDRSYKVELTSNGYFYSYSYYNNKKIGESRIHIEDISSIEYTGGMGELYLKLNCQSSKECSIWTNFGKDSVHNNMIFQVIDSRSGDYIKNIIRNIIIKETGNDIKNQSIHQTQKDTSRKVYYCDSQSAYAYHSTLKCSGLSNCQYQIYSISENSIREKGYRYCELCWK